MTGDGFPTLSPAMREVLAQSNGPNFARWAAIAKGVHGCARPVRLIGDALTVHTETGEIIDRYSTSDEPTGYLLTACGNRRAAVCPACSRIYQADTFHLIRAGLTGGKGVPESVRLHPACSSRSPRLPAARCTPAGNAMAGYSPAGPEGSDQPAPTAARTGATSGTSPATR